MMTRALRGLIKRDTSGSVVVEFALIAPIILGMLLGIFQVGMGMYNYNSMRGAATDIARFAVVTTQKGTFPNDTVLTEKARSIATSLPYNLTSSRLTVSVAEVLDSRVDGATEKTISMTYSVPSMLSVIGIPDVQLTYSRPVFLVQ